MRPGFPSPQVDYASGSIQQPRIGIPLVYRSSEAAVGFGQSKNRSYCSGASKTFPDVAFVTFVACSPADIARLIASDQRIIRTPAFAIEPHPLVPGGDVPQIVGVPLGKTQRKRFF